MVERKKEIILVAAFVILHRVLCTFNRSSILILSSELLLYDVIKQLYPLSRGIGYFVGLFASIYSQGVA